MGKNTSICPDCGRFVPFKKNFDQDFLYVTRSCPNNFHRKELVCKNDEIVKNFFWNSPASKLVEKNNHMEGIRVFDVFITKKCNSNCNVCFAKWCGDSYEEMRIETLRGLLEKVRNARIALNGGEPTTRDDLAEIIKTVMQSGNTPTLYTNGLKLSDRAYLRHLKDSGLEEVFISFDGFDEEIYETVRGGRAQYEKTLNALDNLEKENMKVSMYSTIVRGVNEPQVGKIIDYAASHEFVWAASFKPLYLPGTCPSAKFEKHHVLSHTEILKLINEKIEEVDLDYIRLMQKVFLSMQKSLAGRSRPIYLSWVDLPCVYMVRKGSAYQPLFSYETLDKIQNMLETATAAGVMSAISKILPFSLNSTENLARQRKIFRIQLGCIMPQTSSYSPPIGMVCQKNNELKLYSYLAW
jgi:molybdenum cofactor biosynthesis enzyme MoaA